MEGRTSEATSVSYRYDHRVSDSEEQSHNQPVGEEDDGDDDDSGEYTGSSDSGDLSSLTTGCSTYKSNSSSSSSEEQEGDVTVVFPGEESSSSSSYEYSGSRSGGRSEVGGILEVTPPSTPTYDPEVSHF